MFSRTSRLISTSVLCLSLPAAAHADLTSQDVWNSFQKYLGSFGYDVSSGSTDLQGDRLTVSDVILGYKVPEANMQASIEKMEFRERADGSVVISMSPTVPFSMSAAADSDADLDMTMIIQQTDMTLVATGEVGDIEYAYKASEIAFDFDQLFIEGESVAPEIDFSMFGFDGVARVIEGDVWDLTGSSTSERFTMNMTIDDPEEGVNMVMSMQASDIETSSSTRYPEGLDWGDPATTFDPNIVAKAVMRTGPSAFAMSIKGDENVEISSTAMSADFTVGIENGSVQYGGSSDDNVMTVSTEAMPFGPINISVDRSAFDFLMPMAESEEPRDFRFLLEMLNLDIDDMLWQMFDPGGQLPHDPASMKIDLSGKARAMADLMDPDAMMESDMPFDLDSLDVNELSLSVAGAEVFGQGGFTFDSENTESFDGFPAPTGNLNVDLYGINGLLDTLGNMGLLPPDQAMGARMMMGMFARPADGDDHLKSEIDVQGNGSVFINGQQMR